MLVPKTNNMRKEEGATVGVRRPFCLPYLSSAGWFVRPDGRRFPRKHSTLQESPIKYHKCPTNETPAIFSHLMDSPNQNKYKDADESDKNMSDLKHKNVNDTKTTVHSLFLGCVYTQRFIQSLGEPCCS